MQRRFSKPLVALTVILVLAMLTVLFLFGSRTPALPPLPNPNGYDDFLKAAALLTGDVGNAATLDHDALRELVSTNAEPLRLIRLGLSRNCSVPTESAMTNISGVLADLASSKSLVRLISGEGRLAEMETRYGDAAQCYVDAIRFGREISRGGFIIHRLVGIACEAIGDTPLSKLVPKLTSDEAHPVIAELERIDRDGITWDEVRRNENRFARYQRSKDFNPVTWVMAQLQNWRQTRTFKMRHNSIIAHVRLLSAELAVRCYQSERGLAPAGLEQLVPKYLQRVPIDPFSDKLMIYRPQGTNWVLYSVGVDGVDDGGKPAGRSVSGAVTKGDMFYDSPY